MEMVRWWCFEDFGVDDSGSRHRKEMIRDMVIGVGGG